LIDTLEAAVGYLRDEYPLIANNLSVEILGQDPALDSARRALAYAVERANGDADVLAAGLEGFAEISFDFLRLQGRFLKTGHYARSTATGLSDELYRNEEDMRGYHVASNPRAARVHGNRRQPALVGVQPRDIRGTGNRRESLGSARRGCDRSGLLG